MSGAEVSRWLARPSGSGAVVRATGLGLGLVVAVFLARTLGAQDLGVYQAVLSIAVILGSLTAATAERPAARDVAALDADERDEVGYVVARAHMVVALALVVIVALTLAISFLPVVAESLRGTLRLAALIAPGLALLSLRQWLALPLQGVAKSLFPEQVAQPVLFLALAGLVAYQAGLVPTSALLCYALVVWIVWLIASYRSGILGLLREGLRQKPWVPGLATGMRDGRHFVLLTAGTVLPVYATVPLVAALLNPTDAGLLAISLQLTGLVAVPLQVVSLAMMPHCVRLYRSGDSAGLNTLVRAACSISAAAAVVLAVVLLLSLDTILTMLGPSFAAAGPLVPVLVIGQLVNATLGPNGPTLQMIGAEREVGWIEALVTVVRLAAVALAAIAGSVFAVAVVVTLTVILRNLMLSITLHRKTAILTLPTLSWGHGQRAG